MVDSANDFKLWYYTPSLPAAVIAAMIFGVLTLYHVWRLVATRAWYCIPFVIGGILEVIGYAARAAAHSDTITLTPYIIQSLVLLVAPPFFAASIYMILGKIIRAVQGQHLSPIRVKWLTKIFVCSDIACFLVQSSGGGIQATGKGSSFTLGGHIILAGLILQIISFMFFVIVAGVFHSRLLRQQRRATATSSSSITDVPWQRLLCILYGVSVLIALRNIVRAIEYGMGGTGYLMQHEWTLYVFDGLLMAVTLAVCATWYAVDLRPRVKNIEDGSSSMELVAQQQQQQVKHDYQSWRQ